MFVRFIFYRAYFDRIIIPQINKNGHTTVTTAKMFSNTLYQIDIVLAEYAIVEEEGEGEGEESTS